MAALPGLSALSFLDKYIIGYALGTAAGPALYPFVQDLEVNAYAASQFAPLPPEIAAQVAAENYANLGPMETEASFSGLNKGRFDFMYDVTLTAPGMGELLAMARRGTLQPGQFAFGLRKAKLDTQWDTALADLQNARLSPSDIANAVQQAFMADPGLLAGPVSGPPFHIPTATVSLDTTQELADNGIDLTRAQVLAELAGLPPAPTELAPMYLRGQIDKAGWDAGLREGHTKTKWGDALLYYLTNPLLTPSVEIRRLLKGWQDKPTTDARLALYGYTPQQVQDWYEAEGRPASTHQIHIGYARGATVPGAVDEKDAIYKAVAESDVRPEYADVEYAGRFTYPSAFVLRSLVSTGDITAAEGEQVLLYEGWEPTFAKLVANAWSGTSGGVKADPHVTKAETQLWTATHKAYLNGEAPAATVTANLNLIGVPAAAQPQVVALWNAEQQLVRHGLSSADIRKAYNKQDVNAATGAPWTRPEALTELQRLGWSQAEADQYLDIS